MLQIIMILSATVAAGAATLIITMFGLWCWAEWQYYKRINRRFREMERRQAAVDALRP